MTTNVWEMLKEEFDQYPSDMGGSIKDIKEIFKAEELLSLKFSSFYKKFLMLYGSAIFDGFFVYGLRKQRSMDDSLWSVMDQTNFYKNTQNWPGIDDWYIVSDDGRGNPIGINPKGEVWLSDHDSQFEHIKLADDFEDFIYKLLTDTLYE